MYKLRFRQVHLDFHTSPDIDGIGSRFDKKQFQGALKAGHVDSITCFSKCHHGWTYHDTKVGKKHPHLKGELLREQYDACREIGVNIPVYISAGVDNMITTEHSEWRAIDCDGKYFYPGLTQAGFHRLCFNTPYLDYLCRQIEEAVTMFPECNGIFLDIIFQMECCCNWCMAIMKQLGLDATKSEDRQVVAKMGLERYYKMTTAACRCKDSNMPVFHNSGHIPRGKRDILKYFSHLELESLPTGGWGYDHFPLSAKYCKKLDELDFLGMTGKFHTTWGEFGGFKHPNALRYECAAMLAYGSKCSIGDQLHPLGHADMSTYNLIGAAYKEVEEKEKWCDNVTNVADIAMLSSEACKGGVMSHGASGKADVGANRILLEGHYLYDVVDTEMDLSPYKMVILPDDIAVNPAMKKKLDEYIAGGGKLLLTGGSGLDENGKPMFDIGGEVDGESEYKPNYILPAEGLRADFVNSPLVMYVRSRRLKVTDGQSLGDVYDSYFNRDYRHFCSHQHTPNRPDPSGWSLGAVKGNVMYIAYPFFTLYANMGAVAYKDVMIKLIDKLLGGDKRLDANLPSTGRVTLMDQPADGRYVLHLLYANTISRGSSMPGAGIGEAEPVIGVEVIEDLTPLHDVEVSLKVAKPVKKATLQPQDKEIEFTRSGNMIKIKLDEFTCHQMIVLEY